MSGAIIFRADASPLIGGGHLRRCLTLADALHARGWRCTFVGAIDDGHAALVTQAGHTMVLIAAATAGGGPGWETACWDESTQHADADRFTTASSAQTRASWIVVDHYKLDRTWEARVRGCARLMVIDDLANRPHDCDLLLDQTFGRSVTDYRDLLPPRSRVLTGPTWALLRPEFAREREMALARRHGLDRPRVVLVSMGSTDLNGITARVVTAVADVSEVERIDVTVGIEAHSLPFLKTLATRDARLRLHINSDRMAELMREADLAVGAAGSSSWERCCLGLPTLMLVLATNQRAVASGLASVGASLIVDRPDDLVGHIERLSVPGALERIVAAAAPICDGEGVQRLVNLLTSTATSAASSRCVALRARSATMADAQQLWLWRNDPGTRWAAREQGVVAWPEHLRWLGNSLRRADRTLLIVETVDGEPRATVRFDDDGQDAVVSINIAPDHRGSGMGAAVLATAITEYRLSQRHDLVAEIRSGNIASRRLFERLGFLPVTREVAGFDRFRQPLSK